MNKDTQSSNSSPDNSEEFYAKHKKVYPRKVTGIFASLRLMGVFILLGGYYFVPWLRWDGHQAVLFDLPARKFYIFGLTFWPQDFFYLAALLIIAALSLFFFTALAGRLWCGYACPQTVWTEVFLWIERKVEGSRNQQMKLDKQAMDSHKFSLKALKHFIWITFSAWTGFTFVGYFTPIIDLGQTLFQFNLGPWETFWIVFYSFATYGNAGWMREQVCIYMCPYARFQSAMFDKNTLIISYDETRGENRGSRKKSEDPKEKGLGDCVDCSLCVQVCPTGIDIRDGLQYQCIGCAACVDVCNDVMEKMNYEKGLVRYTTQNIIDGKESNILRPRIVIYGALLIIMSIALIYSIATRIPLELDIIRDRNALYRETTEGLIENIYTLKLINMDTIDHEYRLEINGIKDMLFIKPERTIKIKSGEVVNLPVRIQIDPVNITKTSSTIEFHLKATDTAGLAVTEKARFIGPLAK
ncbi:MAG: cytochrome c oxidase accessory protein CcoG [Gammaproteobacteria bacterium]|nr:cytochrome c oxidase accessory protein CcoG [Gammaproteobacteria bacterium]